MPPAARPPIIIKKKITHAGHHGGAWKVAYADFVTSMMALFIVLWIISSGDPELKAGVARYFRDPAVFDSARGLVPIKEPDQEFVSQPGGEGLKALQEELLEDLRRLKEYPSIAEQISIRMSAEGLVIELIDTDNLAFFDLSSAELKPLLRRVLEVIARRVVEFPNSIAISGHTDARQYHNKNFYSNWELSSARALNARRAMEEMQFPAARVEKVVGYADRFPLSPDKPLDPANRRISILVLRENGELKNQNAATERAELRTARVSSR